MLTNEQAHAVYDVLVMEAGAPDDHMGFDRDSFVCYFTTAHAPEWRFCGSLGFGGKVRMSANHPIPYVDCYREDQTPRRRAIVDKTNAALRELFVHPTPAKEGESE